MMLQSSPNRFIILWYSSMQPMDLASSDQELLQLAKHAEKAQRSEQVLELMLTFIARQDHLQNEQLNLLSTAAKHIFRSLKTAQRTSKWLLQIAEHQQQVSLDLIVLHKTMVEKSLIQQSKKILTVLDSCGAKDKAKFKQGKVILCKLYANLYQYMTECTLGQLHFELAHQTHKLYLEALELASDSQVPRSLQMQVSLNYAVFLYEVIKDRQEACEYGQGVLDQGYDSTLPDRRSCQLTYQLLKDNLLSWRGQDQ